MSTHTPGSWVFNEMETGRKHHGGEVETRYEISPSHSPFYTIATCAVHAEQELANARLIAAAPDLLAALQDSWNPALPSAEREARARAAIAKATGETK